MEIEFIIDEEDIENENAKKDNLNYYINWTFKSKNISFKSLIKGVGDGEEKMAAELNSCVLGQNSNFDMKLSIEGVEYKCDVKKLDKNTFNTGVNGRNALRPIKNKIEESLNLFIKIKSSSIITINEKELLQHFDKISPDELCVSNIQKLIKIYIILNEKRNHLISTLPKVLCPFIKNDGSIDYTNINLLEHYNICLINKQEFSQEYCHFKDTIILLNDISHEYIIDPCMLYNSLNNLVSIFSELKLIFVDELNGYCILNNNSQIKFERITRGSPRFSIII